MRSFIKWLGGKSRYSAQIADAMPRTIRDYYEPFLGSGAVFLELLHRGAIEDTAVLSDANEALIMAWRLVRDSPGTLTRYLMRRKDTKAEYLRIRKQEASKLSLEERAARFVFITNQCFAGAYREALDGSCNASWSASGRPSMEYRCKSIMRIHGLLKRVRTSFNMASFDTVWTRNEHDVLYADPPYLVDAARHSYVASAWTPEKEAKMHNLLAKSTCKVFLSSPYNAHPPGFVRHSAFAPTRNGCKGKAVDGSWNVAFRDALWVPTHQTL